MSINSVKEDEEQKDSVKIKVIMRLFGYMLKYKKQIAFVLRTRNIHCKSPAFAARDRCGYRKRQLERTCDNCSGITCVKHYLHGKCQTVDENNGTCIQ